MGLTGSRFWDASTVAALDTIEAKSGAFGKSVEIIGMNESSQQMGRLTGEFEQRDSPGWINSR